MQHVTRSQLAIVLENEAHNAIAERIRAGCDPVEVFADATHPTGLRKALRKPRYYDNDSRVAIELFEAIVKGHIHVLED